MSKLGHVLATLPVLALLACGGSSDPSGPSAFDPAPTTSSPGADPDAAARAFLRFAQSGDTGADVPWAATVRFSIAGEQVAQLSPEFAARRESWVRCPGAATAYEGRHCPVSALGAVRALVHEGGEARVETAAPGTVGCSTYREPWAGADTTWVRPDDDHRDCFSDFAIAVATDDAGAIVAVDLVLGGP